MERRLHPPPGLRNVASLHQRVVVGVLQCHLVPPVLCPLQPVQIAVSQPPYSTARSVRDLLKQQIQCRVSLTQLALGEDERCGVLVEIPVELDGELAYQFGRPLDFLRG